MRLLTKLTFVLPAVLLFASASTANAAFTFSFSPSSTVASFPGVVAVDLVATNTDASPFPDDLNFFSVTLTPNPGGDPAITLLNNTVSYNGAGTPFFGGGGVPTGGGGVVGTFMANVGPLGTGTTTFSGTINSQAFNNPFVITSQPLALTVIAIPEPSTAGLLGLSMVGLGFIRRRRA